MPTRKQITKTLTVSTVFLLFLASCGSKTVDDAVVTTVGVGERTAVTSFKIEQGAVTAESDDTQEATETSVGQQAKEEEPAAQTSESRSGISSGKANVVLEVDDVDGLTGKVSLKIVKQDKSVGYLFDGSQIDYSDPEDEVEEIRLIRIGDVVYESVEDNKWLEAEFDDYYQDDIFYPLYNDEGKYDLQPVLDLLEENADNAKKTTEGSEQKYSGTIDVQKVSIEGHPAQFPPGLDIMLHDIQSENTELVLDIAVYAQDGLLKKIVINTDSVDDGGSVTLTATYSELGEPQILEAPSEDLLVSDESLSISNR